MLRSDTELASTVVVVINVMGQSDHVDNRVRYVYRIIIITTFLTHKHDDCHAMLPG